MSATVQQIYALNPSTSIHNNDLIYLVQSPYTPGTDSAIKGSDLIAQFEGLPITLTNTHIFVGNVSNVATDVAMSGDATIANTGALTVASIGGKAVTLGGAFTTSGAFAVTQTYTGATNVTFPTTGTLATTSQLPTPSALTSSNDTNVTITLGGTPATSLLQAVSLTMGWTGVLSGSRGGTGVNNGASTITVGGNLTFSGAFTFTGTLTNNTAVTFPTSGTLATTSQLPTPAALTSSNDTNVTITLGGTPATALLQATSLTMGWTGTLAVARGGTAAASFNTNGVIISNTSSTGALAALSLTDGQVVIGSSTGAPLAATLTAGAGISVTNGHNTITIAATNSGTVTSISAGTGITCTPNPITGTGTVALTTPVSLANGGTNASLTANNGGVVWSNASQLQILSGTATANQVLLSGSTATPAWSTATYPATTTINQILYSSAANTITGLATANSSILVTSSGGVPSLSTTLPSFTTGTITFNPTTGGLVGTTTNDNASSGNVGEFVSSVIASGSAVSLVTGTSKTITSISLTAGDWDCQGEAYITAAGTTTVGNVASGISTTNNTLPGTTPAVGSAFYQYVTPTSLTAGSTGFPTFNLVPCRISIASTTTVYLVINVNFSVSTASAYGKITARRVR